MKIYWMIHESSEHKVLFGQLDVTLSSYSQFFRCEVVELTHIAYLSVRKAFWEVVRIGLEKGGLKDR